jgi:hypothetical protein
LIRVRECLAPGRVWTTGLGPDDRTIRPGFGSGGVVPEPPAHHREDALEVLARDPVRLEAQPPAGDELEHGELGEVEGGRGLGEGGVHTRR